MTRHAVDVLDRVTAYAQAVVAGQVEGVGEFHRLACARHINDLERAATQPGTRTPRSGSCPMRRP